MAVHVTGNTSRMGKPLSTPHRRALKAKYEANRRERRKAERRCLNCTRPAASVGLLCARCAEGKRNRAAGLVGLWVAFGLCSWGGSCERERVNAVYCEEHRIRANAARMARYYRNKAARP